jgi:predicted transcriptional regulator YdeE
MRILKYIFLLLLLAFVGLTVFVTTQKGIYDVKRSKIIKTSRTTVFDYINDYRNWETFGSWMDDAKETTFDYSSKTTGIGGSFSWRNKDKNGFIKTIYVKENDSLSQKLTYNGTTSNVYWTFKDTVGGTKVTWANKGKMDFMTKIYSFFNGGIDAVLGNMIEKNLFNLDKTLDYEMKTYSIKVNGIVPAYSGFYLKQSVTCRIKSVPKNIKIMMPRMVQFFKKNNLSLFGKPFVLYEKYDVTNDIVTFSVCIPVKEKINVTSGSDVSSGELLPFTCLKTTLVGDYSHTQEAWEKARKHIADSGLKENFSGQYMEVYSKTIDDVKSPSKWITDIYIPVFPMVIAPKIVTPSVTTPVVVPVPEKPLPVETE